MLTRFALLFVSKGLRFSTWMDGDRHTDHIPVEVVSIRFG